MIRCAIVGTGPSALATAEALISRGIVPDILDLGAEAPPASEALRARLAANPPERWSPSDRIAAQAQPKGGPNVPRKGYFGSDYPYADASLGIASHGPLPSRAFGGYSTIWGAAILAPKPEDLADWPVRNMAASIARIWARLPKSDSTVSIPYGSQMAALHRDARHVNDTRVRHAALAVAATAQAPDHPNACNGCGLCLSGCPYGAIFGTAAPFRRLAHEGRVRLRQGLFVLQVRETADRLALDWIDAATGNAGSDSYERVFLAAGAIGSTRIVLRSRALFDRDVEMRDSQKILIPILRRHAPAGALAPTGATLAGLFVDLPPDATSAYWRHLQITGTNPLLLAHFGIGPDPARGRWRKRLLGPVLARLMVGWGGLHSTQSGKLVLRLSPSAQTRDNLAIRAVPARESLPAARRAVAGFRRALAPARTYVPPIGWRLVAPGEGNHIGASLPMRAAGGDAGLSSDVLGRPLGFARLHVVDSSVFPSIPATTMLVLSMANADRVAREVPLGD